MPLTTSIDKLAENIESRLGAAFFQYNDGTTDVWGTFGILGDISVNMTPMKGEADIADREKQMAVKVEVSIVVKQTSLAELAAAASLCNVAGAGAMIKITDDPVDVAAVDAATGFTFNNVFPAFSAPIKYKAQDSRMEITFGGIVALSAVEAFADPDGIMTFDV